MSLRGDHPVVVCGGELWEAATMEEAQDLAVRKAHSKSADAFILKPVTKVVPKLDVTVTDL